MADVEGKNMFGGGNPHGLYTPMSEDEMEVMARMCAARDFRVVVDGIGTLESPSMDWGDKRITVYLDLTFEKPDAPTPLYYLDLQLLTGAGQLLFADRKPVMYGGKPVEVMAGVILSFAWDIAVDHMRPEFVKMYKPGAIGITSRRLDKETGERTDTGNMQLDGAKKQALHEMDKLEAASRVDDMVQAAKAAARSVQDKLIGKKPE